ncbi:hypothetical protein ES703_72302 [subsurface metagenome]
MDEVKDWLWLVKTNKGDFFITVIGNWTQEEAATRVRGVFRIVLKLNIIGMIPRKRVTGPDDAVHAEDGIFILYDPRQKLGRELNASIFDIAPSILHLMGLEIPSDMMGQSILHKV